MVACSSIQIMNNYRIGYFKQIDNPENGKPSLLLLVSRNVECRKSPIALQNRASWQYSAKNKNCKNYLYHDSSWSCYKLQN